MQKKFSAEEIRVLVQENDRVLYGAIIKLYEQQTDSEKSSRSTNETNGRGFNKYDAEFMTSIAEFLKRNKYLTDKQKAIARKKMVKYSKQLVVLQEVQ